MKKHELSTVETHKTGTLRYYVDGVRVTYDKYMNLSIQARMYGSSDTYYTKRDKVGDHVTRTKHYKTISLP